MITSRLAIVLLNSTATCCFLFFGHDGRRKLLRIASEQARQQVVAPGLDDVGARHVGSFVEDNGSGLLTSPSNDGGSPSPVLPAAASHQMTTAASVSGRVALHQEQWRRMGNATDAREHKPQPTTAIRGIPEYTLECLLPKLDFLVSQGPPFPADIGHDAVP
ncbi:hypothetical protein LX32DRAFT_639351 [Colletotrichum zoysiae]|uniref:Secreted protein n=1 Tax=Colletotrichum zoysiae TaxID=1216348 RepID=A0AAD9HHH1_9PEZI|nr:hypothetical protein LX32DRAFT_639351 [Colletotrichum zoysiae]